MRVAILATDNREQQKKYDLDKPFFGTAPAAALHGFTGLKDEMEVHVVSCSKRKMTIPNEIAPNIIFHQPIVPYLGWGRTAFAGCCMAVRKLLKRINPDIVHGQGTERDCAISAVYSGFPNVITIHGNMERIYRMNLMPCRSYYWLASKLETHALRRTAGVLCNSRHTRSLVEGRTRKTWLVPNPLRPAFLQRSDTAKRHNNPEPVFLVIGVLSRLKRPLEILKTMKSLFDAGHRFRLRFIGSLTTDEDYTRQFTDYLESPNRQGFAEHVGPLEEADLIRAMDGADALIHFPEEESFGLVVAESLARNLKVFAARIGGIPDILEETDGSEMFDDFDGLRGGIASWLESGCPRAEGNAAIMRERYAPEVIARRHLEIYREILNVGF